MLKNKLLIKEVCIKLGFRIEMINDVYKYINSFTESKTHSIFAEEVIVATCIYLSSKINEDFRRIRGIYIINLDIINVMYFAIGKYDKIKELNSTENLSEEQITCLKYLLDDDFKHDSSLIIQMIPNLTLDKYSILRDEVLKAEQHLLRIINYEFESKTKELYIILLNYADLIEFDESLIQLSWNILNDSFEIMTDLFLNKSDSLIIMSILYLAYRWKKYYNKNTNTNSIANINNEITQKKEINFDEILIKLKLDKSEMNELSFKIISCLLKNTYN